MYNIYLHVKQEKNQEKKKRKLGNEMRRKMSPANKNGRVKKKENKLEKKNESDTLPSFILSVFPALNLCG